MKYLFFIVVCLFSASLMSHTNSYNSTPSKKIDYATALQHVFENVENFRLESLPLTTCSYEKTRHLGCFSLLDLKKNINNKKLIGDLNNYLLGVRSGMIEMVWLMDQMFFNDYEPVYCSNKSEYQMADPMDEIVAAMNNKKYTKVLNKQIAAMEYAPKKFLDTVSLSKLYIMISLYQYHCSIYDGLFLEDPLNKLINMKEKLKLNESR